jgi:hypothetical protein
LFVTGCAAGGDAGAAEAGPDGGDDSAGEDSAGGEDFSCGAPCTPAGAFRCTGDVIEVCGPDAHACMAWQVARDCADSGLLCDDSGAGPTCVAPETCDDLLRNQDETDVDCGGDVCPPCAIGGDCGDDGDCETGVCVAGVCLLCRAGEFGCFGNWLRQCSPDGSSWADVDHCNAVGGYVCNPATGACELAVPVGHDGSAPTGTYYRFAHFTMADSPFLGGADVDALGERIFVNRDGAHVDVYSVTLLDSDGDGRLEPSQHPDNPDDPGPIEERVLALVQTYDVPIGGTHNNELYIREHSIVFTRSTTEPGDIFEYDSTTAAVTTIVDVATGLWNQVLGWDDVNARWYTAVPYERWVYSLDPVANEWVLEFAYPNLSGDHSDGLEVVTDIRTGTPYVYVSDMTSDFIGQYRKDADGVWIQENLFQYANPDPEDVEGMGFGALRHFWITNEAYGSGVQVLYEIGGGDIDQYVQ